MDKVICYAVGFVCLSVCADKDIQIPEIELVANTEHPTGITHGWSLSNDKTFANGTPMPCPCDKFPDRVHYLLNC